MKPSSPWSVKGVEPEAREAAKLAARRAGMPLGMWLSHTIRKSAAEQLRGGHVPPHLDGAPEPRPAAPGHPGEAHPARPPAPTTEAVLESINRLAAKIEASEARTAEVLAPLAHKVQELSSQVEEVKENKAIESNPLERALARMSERLDQMEDGPRRPGGSGGGGGGIGRDRGRKPGFFSRLFSD